MARGGGAEEERHIGDLDLLDHGAQRDVLQALVEVGFGRDAERRRFLSDDALAARIVHEARQDGVDADAVRPDLAREGLCEAHHRVFGDGVGKPQRQAGPAAGGGDVDDRAAACRLHGGYREARAIELAADVDRKRAVPVGGSYILGGGGRAGDAGIVHQHIQAAESRESRRE